MTCVYRIRIHFFFPGRLTIRIFYNNIFFSILTNYYLILIISNFNLAPVKMNKFGKDQISTRDWSTSRSLIFKTFLFVWLISPVSFEEMTRVLGSRIGKEKLGLHIFFLYLFNYFIFPIFVINFAVVLLLTASLWMCGSFPMPIVMIYK